MAAQLHAADAFNLNYPASASCAPFDNRFHDLRSSGPETRFCFFDSASSVVCDLQPASVDSQEPSSRLGPRPAWSLGIRCLAAFSLAGTRTLSHTAVSRVGNQRRTRAIRASPCVGGRNLSCLADLIGPGMNQQVTCYRDFQLALGLTALYLMILVRNDEYCLFRSSTSVS